MSLSCERCRVELEVGFNEDAQITNNEIRLQELTMNFGVTTFLCYRCRKAYHRFSCTNKLFSDYSLVNFRLRCWQARWRRKPGDDKELQKGEELFKTLADLDVQLMKLTENWIGAGPSHKEMNDG